MIIPTISTHSQVQSTRNKMYSSEQNNPGALKYKSNEMKRNPNSSELRKINIVTDPESLTQTENGPTLLVEVLTCTPYCALFVGLSWFRRKGPPCLPLFDQLCIIRTPHCMMDKTDEGAETERTFILYRLT